MHQSLQEDEGLLSYIWKSTFINSTSRYLKSICWLNATTSELCLLFTKLRASHTTRVGWEGGIYVSTYFKISRSGWEILPIALCPYINFALFFTFNFVSKLPPTPYPLPPLPPGQPANHSTLRTKIRFQDVVTFFSMALLTVSLPYRVGMTVMGVIQKSSTENPFK